MELCRCEWKTEGREAITADSKHLAKEIKSEGLAFWLDSVTPLSLFGYKEIPSQFLPPSREQRGEKAEHRLMKEFHTGKTLTFEMFSVISSTASFRQRPLH